MTFRVTTDLPQVEIIIPAATGSKDITLTVPAFDCVTPHDSFAMNEQLKDMKDRFGNPITNNGLEVVRFMLSYYNSTKTATAAIDKLVPRQLSEINEYWEKESGLSVGES